MARGTHRVKLRRRHAVPIGFGGITVSVCATSAATVILPVWVCAFLMLAACGCLVGFLRAR